MLERRRSTKAIKKQKQREAYTQEEKDRQNRSRSSWDKGRV
jgi:hypothetical protein